MELASPVEGLLGDDPVADEANDVLARGAFAARVAELVDHVAAETPSAVLALMGPWGGGKTSVLHFARHRLEATGRWKVVEFNPWMVSDLPSLVQEFFTTLVAALPDDRKGKKLRQKMAGYAKSVAPLATPFKVFGISADQALRSAGELLAGDQSIEARRRELEESLRAHGQPVLLVADDLDRLHPDELLLVFKLVRLVGRLPNVYYLLAFDEETILDVLTATELANSDRTRAVAYLEKMVQVRLDLPPVHPRLAGQLLDQLLNALLEKNNVELDGRASYRLGNAYRTHLVNHLHEPRQVKRFCAQIEALYPLVAAEVDFVDFAIITFLRTFHPGVTELLSAHKPELTGTALEFGNKPTHEQRREAWRDRLAGVGVDASDVDAVLALLSQLFVPIRSALERMEYGSTLSPELAAARRVGSAEYFDRYFHLGVGPDDLPDATIAAALNEVLAGTLGDAWAAVIALLPTNAELALDKLRRLAPATSDSAMRILPALASIDDLVPDGGFLGRARIVHNFWAGDLLLLAEPRDARKFVELLAETGGAGFVADAFSHALRSAEKEDVSLTTAFREMRVEAARLVAEELERQASLTPEATSGVLRLLADWAALDPDADRQTWMRSVVEANRWPLPDVLGMFVPVGTTSTADGPSRSALGDTELGFLDQVLGLDFVVERVGPLPEPTNEPFFGDTDVSWDARVRRAVAAVARWAVAHAAQTALEPDDPDDETT